MKYLVKKYAWLDLSEMYPVANLTGGQIVFRAKYTKFVEKYIFEFCDQNDLNVIFFCFLKFEFLLSPKTFRN